MGTTLPWRRGDGGNFWGDRAKKNTSKGTGNVPHCPPRRQELCLQCPRIVGPQGPPHPHAVPSPWAPNWCSPVARDVWFGLTQSNLLYSNFPSGGLKYPQDPHYPRDVLLDVAKKSIFSLKMQFDGKFLLSISTG